MTKEDTIEQIQAIIIKHIPPSKKGDLSDVYICSQAIKQYYLGKLPPEEYEDPMAIPGRGSGMERDWAEGRNSMLADVRKVIGD